MSDLAALVGDNLEIWTGAIERKSGAGRGGGKRLSFYGIDRLRSLILNLAVRGKLLPQMRADESASELLKRIESQRRHLVSAGTISKERTGPPASTDPPFSIPPSWEWTQLSKIGHDWGQKEPAGDFTYIDVGSIDQRLGTIAKPGIVGASAAPSRARKVVRRGTVVYATVRPYLLNIAIVAEDFDPEPIASTAFAVVHPFDGVDPGFLFRYLRSPAFVAYVEACQTGIAYPAINDKQFFSAWFPLPPLAEQQRIVAKVDELMALCDALERESTTAVAAHQALVEKLLATLIDSGNAADLATNWSRMKAHFDALFSTDPSIDALKRTIVQLAVMGMLMPQGLQDVPASKLLQKAKVEKRRLVSEGFIKAEKPMPMISDAEVPFGVPHSWEWARVGDLALFTQYGTSRQALPGAAGIPVLAMGNINGGIVDTKTDKCIPAASEELPDLFLEPGDMLYNRTNSYELVGKTGIYEGASQAYTFASYLIRIRLMDGFYFPKYVNLVMNSPYFRATQIVPKITKQTGQANVSGSAMRNMLVPVPPYQEQQRIVARVDELMALCDSLKSHLAQAGVTQRHLADAIVEKAAA